MRRVLSSALLAVTLAASHASAFVPPSLGPPVTDMATIPATHATLGGARTAGGLSFDAPERDVHLGAFAIDRHEVTVAAYAKCVAAGACAVPDRSDCNVPEAITWGKPGYEQHPVNCVTYAEAAAFCTWAHKRLPRSAEWEVAERGPALFTFPWGNDLPVLGASNGCDHSCATVARAVTGVDYEPVWSDKTFDDGWAMTAPVGSFPGDKSPYGVLDLAANLAEWVDPEGEADLGGSVSFTPVVAVGDRQLRGGSWATNVFSTMSFAGRDRVDGSFRGGWVGFRCARDANAL